MAKRSGSKMNVFGVALIVLGTGLAIWGYQLSGSVGSQITKAVTGSDTEKVLMYYIAGAISFIAGLNFLKK